MNGRELVILCAIVSVIVAIASSILARKRASDSLAARKLDLLEKALQHPGLDDATKIDLLRSLAARHQDPHQVRVMAAIKAGGNWWPTLWYGAGWFLFVICGCILGAGAMGLMRGVEEEVVLPMALVGFAMLTLPAALRELTRRSGVSPVNR